MRESYSRPEKRSFAIASSLRDSSEKGHTLLPTRSASAGASEASASYERRRPSVILIAPPVATEHAPQPTHMPREMTSSIVWAEERTARRMLRPHLRG